MPTLRNTIVTASAMLLTIGCLLAEVCHTFNSTRIRVNCGEPGTSGTVSISQEVDINEPFAVQLGWPSRDSVRYYEESRTLSVGGLNGSPHTGLGGGYNEAGFQLLIDRVANNGQYYYSQRVENIYPNKACIEWE